MKENRIKYTIKEKTEETKDVVTLKLICNGGIPEYKSGQFITVFFEDTGNPEGKSYTISSEPSSSTLNITVKGMGKFSNKLCSMNVGDILEASVPYGYFYSESEETNLIMIAGGIGIAPFRSMIVESLNKNPSRKIFLFYSNKTKDDIVFKDEFENMSMQFASFIVKNHMTQETDMESKMIKGRIKINDILEYTESIQNKEFLICGSIPFVRDFWRNLKEAGISEETIYTEVFF